MAKKNFLVIGDGGWGTTLTLLLYGRGFGVRLWSPFSDYAGHLRRYRTNPRYLPGVRIPRRIPILSDEAEASRDVSLAVVAVPSKFLGRTLKRFKNHLRSDVPIVSAVKGIESEGLRRASELVRQILGTRRIAVLSGPSHAEEVAMGLPATVVVASEDADLRTQVQRDFSTPRFRIYTTDDVIGVELGGSLKNIIGIAAGIADGLGLGDNAKAALMTRGMVEIARLGAELGARAETFAGLSGIGDLITTCISPYGRNLYVGREIGKGRKVREVLSSMQMVAEGVQTTKAVRNLARRLCVEMPITEEVYRILFRNKSPIRAVTSLMTRSPKAERLL